MSENALIDKNFMQIAREMQRLRGIDGEYDGDSGSSGDRVERRRTIYNLEKSSKRPRTIGTLDVAFKKRFFNLKTEENPGELSIHTSMLFIKSFVIIILRAYLYNIKYIKNN